MIDIFIGIVLLYFGAEGLVRGSSRLASHFGIPPLVIGLTIVAFGTSAPELTVSIAAAIDGVGDVAVGNVVGSNIFNIAVILGLTALIQPPVVHLDLIRREIPFMIGVSLAGLALVACGHIPRIAGMFLFSLLIAYTVYAIRSAGAQSGDEAEEPVTGKSPVWVCVLLMMAGLGVLILGSRLFVVGAVTVARGLGISEAVIGLTVVAAGTSLPELATSLVAALKKQSDVAIGNIVGSNIFNVLGILGLTASVHPIDIGGIGLRDALFMTGFSMLLLPFAFSKLTISRMEGAIFLAIYGVYLFLLWPG